MKRNAPKPLFSTLAVEASDRQTQSILHLISRGDNPLDFTRIIPMPARLDIEAGKAEDRAINLYRYFLSKREEPENETRDEEEFLELLNHKDQRTFRMGKELVRNIDEYGFSSYPSWCRTNWGTDRNAVNAAKLNSNTIVFAANATPPLNVICELSEQYSGAKFILTWEDASLLLANNDVMKYRVVYENGRECSFTYSVAQREIAEYFRTDELGAPFGLAFEMIPDEEDIQF